MDEAPALIYLEADDEVTSVVRRLRGATEPRIVVVAPGRSRATSSVVALRLLGGAAAEGGRDLSVVGDALTRSLAAEAGVAAYATVDDARRAAPIDPGASAPRRAGIHVVRGAEADDTAPTLAAAPIEAMDAATAETRSVPISRVEPRRAALARRRHVPVAVAATLLGLATLGTGVAAAVLLPGATVTIVPGSVEIPAQSYTIPVTDAQRRTGSVEETLTVSATGTYPILTPASGTVTFLNWNVTAVRVPAGTSVAAGDQSFTTLAAVDVPAGSIRPDGRLESGEADADVVATSPGPAGNVPAHAINTVQDGTTAARLRGFANNSMRVVDNVNPTSGGSESTGTEFSQTDVDDALATLRAALADAASAEIGAGNDLNVAVGPEEPVIEGVDGLVGTRDVAEAELRGSLAYDRWLVDLEALESVAADRLAQDGGAIPAGHELAPEATAVSILEVVAIGSRVEATVEVRGGAQRVIAEGSVVERIRGLSADEARVELRDFGDATLDLWPGWVTEVPQLEWRIDVRIEPGGGFTPLGSNAPASSP